MVDRGMGDLDALDRALLHALQIDGRAAARAVADVLGVAETTVTRRYQRLRRDHRLRVVGVVNTALLGESAWLVRLRTTPDAATTLAAALARRDDTSWIHLLSGGTEVLATVRSTDTDTDDELLLTQLPRTRRIQSMSAHRLLRAFTLPQTWGALAALDEHQVAALRPAVAEPAGDDAPMTLDAADRALLATLAQDGRASQTRLAAATGWSESTVRRRLRALREAGVLAFQLDVEPAVLGRRTQARLWMTVAPRSLAAAAEAMARHPEVAFVAATTGASNLTAALACRHDRDLYDYVSERIAGLDGVATVETAPVSRTVKRGTEPLP